jgi:hypothetical protein
MHRDMASTRTSGPCHLGRRALAGLLVLAACAQPIEVLRVDASPDPADAAAADTPSDAGPDGVDSGRDVPDAGPDDLGAPDLGAVDAGEDDAGPGPMCGDGLVTGTERCDGLELSGVSCVGLGLGPGDLSCNLDCESFDTSACAACVDACLGRQCGASPAPGCAGSCGECDAPGGEICAPLTGLCIRACTPGLARCSPGGGAWLGCGWDSRLGIDAEGAATSCAVGESCDATSGKCAGPDCLAVELMLVVDRSASFDREGLWLAVERHLDQRLRDHQHVNRIGVRSFPGTSRCSVGATITPRPSLLDVFAPASLAPGGEVSSPIAAALSGLEAQLATGTDGARVLLITDGEETCGAPQDALRAASELFRRGVRVHVVAVGNAIDRGLLDGIARVGGTESAILAADAAAVGPALERAFGELRACRNPRGQVSVGWYHSCGLGPRGDLRCWGRDLSGESTPPGGRFVALGAATSATCAVRDDGSLSCWGRNYAGQTNPPAGRGFVSVSGGESHFCALRDDGTAACWGDDDSGQSTPPAGEVFAELAMGSFSSCGLRRSDGRVVCWGQPRPPSPSGSGYRALAGGSAGWCAIRGSDGTLDCTTSRLGPTPSGAFEQVGVGYQHACGVRPTGAVECWGSNSWGESTPPTNLSFSSVSANYQHGCGVTTDDRFRCWGYDGDGQSSPPP